MPNLKDFLQEAAELIAVLLGLPAAIAYLAKGVGYLGKIRSEAHAEREGIHRAITELKASLQENTTLTKATDAKMDTHITTHMNAIAGLTHQIESLEALVKAHQGEDEARFKQIDARLSNIEQKG